MNGVCTFISSIMHNVSDTAYESLNGVVGEDEIAPHLRIVFVNGIMNTSEDCEQTAKKISEIFENCKIHFTYNPSHGLMQDIIRAIKSLILGTYHNMSECLVQNIRLALDEVKGDKKEKNEQEEIKLKGRVIVLAHSGGGLMLDYARKILTQEELDRIEVYTFGSAKIFSAESFNKVSNYQSCSDFVPTICQLLQGNIFRSSGKVVKLGSYRNIPLSTHTLLSQDYHKALANVKQEVFDSVSKDLADSLKSSAESSALEEKDVFVSSPKEQTDTDSDLEKKDVFLNTPEEKTDKESDDLTPVIPKESM
jgi:hypothetical protein